MVIGVRLAEVGDGHDTDDEAVDGDDTSHDDWDERLHGEVGAELGACRDGDAGFGGAVGGSVGWEKEVLAGDIEATWCSRACAHR